MSTHEPGDRRHFLEAVGALALGGLLPSPADAGGPAPGGGPPDPPRELRPSGADPGSLFADVARLAEGRPYEYSFLGDRFRDLDEFKRTARARLFELLLYRPAPAPPRAEVVERVERETHVREKVLFDTAPRVRVPAYV